MALVKQIVPVAGFEEDYARYVERKAQVEAEVRIEFEKVLAERTAKLDELIALTSEEIEVEVPDEEEVAEEAENEVQ